jgi:hypothetical protein
MQCLHSTNVDDCFQKSVEQGWDPIIRMGSENNIDKRSKDPNLHNINLTSRIADPDPHYFGKLETDPH